MLQHLADLRSESNLSPEEFQYYCFLGNRVRSARMVMSLAEAVYISELRSKPTVHPTLRRIAIALGQYVRDEIGFPVHLDETADVGVVPKRGTHYIQEKS